MMLSKYKMERIKKKDRKKRENNVKNKMDKIQMTSNFQIKMVNKVRKEIIKFYNLSQKLTKINNKIQKINKRMAQKLQKRRKRFRNKSNKKKEIRKK